MSDVDLNLVQANLVRIQEYARKSADTLDIFPRQGLGSHYLSTVAILANETLELFKGETNNDKLKREQFFANQVGLFYYRTETGPGKAETTDHAENSGRLEPACKS